MAITYRSVKGSALTHDELDNNFKHFTGSHSVTGSLIVSGTVAEKPNLHVLGQLAVGASAPYVFQASNPSGSVSISGSLNVSGSINVSGSGPAVTSTQTGSFASTGSNTFSGSQTTSGSSTITGSLVITGSLTVSGSTINNIGPLNQTGISTLIGDSTITGSLLVTGSSYIFKGLPTSQPTVSGSLWCSGSAGAGSKYLVVFTGI